MDQLTAVVWDFDGTLVDTRQKNLNVTRRLVELLRGIPADSLPALRSLASYERALHRHNHWKDFYREELGMTDADIARAEQNWLEQQVLDETEATSYDGILEVLEELAHLPHGIVSLNARSNILRFLEQLEMHRHFDEVLGFEAVQPHRQKPHPEALVACIDRLTESRPGKVLYIGDHASDMECARNASRHFLECSVQIEVIGIGAVYSPLADASEWEASAHFRAEHPREILTFVAGLASRVS